ncbi:hypothetical protein [Methanosphaera sp. WGK6]|uniref:hypothetical protein n=1 Tax=Methanosphaera sp. WGK6 TaxID=1561964 RepID=UPI00084C2F3A|nr:hypothetical protein [Methanosphaera sp. WGK6]OED30908.1 hypothetical protein NL43_00950 [Methanosphaera sp. WGK6]
MSIQLIEGTILDDMYQEDDFEITFRIIIKNPQYELYAWDGLEWSKKGFNRVYTNRNSQYEYDEFVERIFELRDKGLLFEVARELEEDQSYFFEEERIYLYVESKKEISINFK